MNKTQKNIKIPSFRIKCKPLIKTKHSKTKRRKYQKKMKFTNGGTTIGLTNIFSTINNVKDGAIKIMEKFKEVATDRQRALEYGIDIDKFTLELKRDAEARGINYDVFMRKISDDVAKFKAEQDLAGK